MGKNLVGNMKNFGGGDLRLDISVKVVLRQVWR